MSDTTHSLPSVTAALAFLDRSEGTPANYFDVAPPVGRPRMYPTRSVAVRIEDARPIAGELSLSHQGFVVRSHPAAAHDDRAIENLVRRAVGARRALVFDRTHRSSAIDSRSGGGPETAVRQVHNDYTPTSGPARVREMLARHAPDEAIDAVMQRRFAILNVWRPTNGVVEQLPLAIADMRTVRPEDHVDAELHWRERTGFVSAVRHHHAQRWFYVPRMRPDEVLIFTTYDSVAREGRHFGAHSAFDDPTSPPNARVRESVEARIIALF
jgi:hypothetical protein